MFQDSSLFRIYGIGTVANQLITGNEPISVFLHELTGFVDGVIGDDIKTNTVKSSDGKVYSVKVNTSNIVKAVWINNNSNRVTPPNVRPGEKVEIWTYGDSDKYYWKTMGSELDLRGLEHVKYVYKNTDETVAVDDSNSYTYTISTLNKLVVLNTSANNGELTSYNIGLDTMNGTYQILDGRDNHIKLLSGDDRLDVNVNNAVSMALTKLSITNGSDEIVSLLIELIEAIIAEQHIGNLGIDTKLNPQSIQKYEDIKSRLEAFKE